jgi:hypothetical protein
MKTKQDLSVQPVAAKKQWVKPLVEIITTDVITTGSIPGNPEGAWVAKYYNGSGVLTRELDFFS